MKCVYCVHLCDIAPTLERVVNVVGGYRELEDLSDWIGNVVVPAGQKGRESDDSRGGGIEHGTVVHVFAVGRGSRPFGTGTRLADRQKTRRNQAAGVAIALRHGIVLNRAEVDHHAEGFLEVQDFVDEAVSTRLIGFACVARRGSRGRKKPHCPQRSVVSNRHSCGVLCFEIIIPRMLTSGQLILLHMDLCCCSATVTFCFLSKLLWFHRE